MKRLLVGGLSAALLLPITASAASPAAVAAGQQKTYFAQGGDSRSASYKPHNLLISPNGVWTIRKAKWSAWTSTTAKGRGTFRAETCNPDCASGPATTNAVRITLSKPKAVCGKQFFTMLAVYYTGKHVAASKRHGKFDVEPEPICGS
jgi:hypothetical protein